MKIAIHGKMCSGKTFISNHLINYYLLKNIELKKVSFADKVYDIAYDLFKMKNKDRKLLQQIGTKMREIDENIWIKYVLNNNIDNIIIDDARYKNEIINLKKNGFIIIKIDIDKDKQLKRLKYNYPDTYIDHIFNMNHDSENLLINDNIFDLIVKSDDKILLNIINFINKYYNLF